jgi:hypothetical protein
MASFSREIFFREIATFSSKISHFTFFLRRYGATGAASYAFIDAVRNSQPNVTYADLLAIMRDTLVGKYSQKIQMSTGFPTDMNIPFIF